MATLLTDLPEDVLRRLLINGNLSVVQLLRIGGLAKGLRQVVQLAVCDRFECSTRAPQANPYPALLMACNAFTTRHGNGHVAMAMALVLSGDVRDGEVLRLEERLPSSSHWRCTIAKVENASPHEGARSFSHFSEESGRSAPIGWTHTAWQRSNCQLGGPMFLPNRIFSNLSRVRLF